MEKLLIILCVLFTTIANGQNLCIKIDSLKVYHIPQNAQSNVGFSSGDIRNSDLSEKIVIVDSIRISSFARALPLNGLSGNDFGDMKMVIDVYTQMGMFSLSIDNKLSILSEEKVYNFNDPFLQWLKDNFQAWLKR